MSANAYNWSLFDHAVTPGIEAIARGMVQHKNFLSTGFCAIAWAFANGAQHVYLAGYGGSEHKAKISRHNKQLDQFATNGWLAGENAILDKLAKEGVITYLD